jgi:hypothetical protein
MRSAPNTFTRTSTKLASLPGINICTVSINNANMRILHAKTKAVIWGNSKLESKVVGNSKRKFPINENMGP